MQNLTYQEQALLVIELYKVGLQNNFELFSR